jgi:porin
MFGDGVSFSPSIDFPVKYFGKDATHSFGGSVTTKEATPFDAIRQAIIQAIIPNAPINPVRPQRGSWSAYYNYSMYVVERARGDGWGFFSQLSVADKKVSPITTFFDLGFGGNGLFNARHQDQFGLAYAYTDLNSDLKDNLDLTSLTDRLRAEHQVEIFYNLHVSPWLQLTGDLQVIRPNRPAAETAVVPGGRLRIVF